MTLERIQYEKGWGHCNDCRARRPCAELRPTYHRNGVTMVRVWTCTNKATCELLKAARARR